MKSTPKKWSIGFLCFGVFLSIPVSAGWIEKPLISEKNFGDFLTPPSTGIDNEGIEYVAYGGDYLWLAEFNGIEWLTEKVDTAFPSGKSPIVLIADSHLNIIYIAGGMTRHAQRLTGSSQWIYRIISPVAGSTPSAKIDSDGHIHLLYVFGNRTLMYHHFDGEDWTQEIVCDGPFMGYGCSLDLTTADSPVVCVPKKEVLGYDTWGSLILDSLQTEIGYRDTSGSWIFSRINAISWDVYGVELFLDSSDLPHILGVSFLSDMFPYDSLWYYHFNGYTWLTEELENPCGFNTQVSIKEDSSGRIHMVHGSSDAMSLKYWVFDTDNWTLESEVAGDANYWPSISLDLSERPFVAAVDFFQDRIDLLKYDQNSWHIETLDQSEPTDYYYGLRVADMVLDLEGNPHIVCRHDEELFHIYDSDGEWIYQKLNPGIHTADIAGMQIDSGGLIHLAYNYPSGMYATGGISGWDAIEIPVGLTEYELKSLALDPQEYPYMTAYDYRNGHLYLVWKNPGGTWQYSLIESGLDSGEYSSVAIDSNENVHVSYYEAQNADLKYALRTGGSWSTETVDGWTGFRGYHNDIAVNDLGEPYITYFGDGLMMAVKSGGIWTVESIADCRPPFTSICLDSNGYPHVAANNLYVHWDGGEWNIDPFSRYSCESASLVLDSDDQPQIVFWDQAFDLLHVKQDTSAPILYSMTPGSYRQGDIIEEAIIYGENLSNVQAIDLGSSVLIDGWQILSQSQISIDFHISETAPTGWHDLAVSAFDSTGILQNAIFIDFGPPTIENIDPGHLPRGLSETVLIKGKNLTNTDSVDFGNGITVNGFDVMWNEAVAVDIAVAEGAAPGFRNVSVTTNAGSTIAEDAFEVLNSVSILWDFDINLPRNVYRDSLFTITVKALDFNGQFKPDFNGTVNLNDSLTSTLQPDTIELINGIGQISAEISMTSTGNTIVASYQSRIALSAPFSVHQAVADCIYEYPERPAGVVASENQGNHSLIASTDGTVYATLGDDNLWLFRKAAGTWTSELIDESSGTGSNQSMAMDSEGNLHIIYLDKTNYSVKYARKNNFGWSIEEIDRPVFIAMTDIEVDAAGRLHATWSSAEGQWYAIHQNGNWTKTLVCDTAGSECSIAVDSQDRPHLVHYSSLNNIVFYHGYLNNVYQTVELGSGEYVQIDTDSNDRPHVVFQGITHKYWTGSQWMTETIPGTTVSANHYLNFIIDGSDHLHVAATRYPNISVSYPQYFYFDGSVWYTTDFSSTSERTGRYLDFTVDPTGKAHFVYWHEQGVMHEYSTYAMGDWNRETLLISRFSGHNPDIVISEEGNPQIFYVEYEYAMGISTQNDFQYVTVRESIRDKGNWITRELFRHNKSWVALTAEPGSDGFPDLVYLDMNLLIGGTLHFCEPSGDSWISEAIATGIFKIEGEGGQPFFDLTHTSEGVPIVGFYRTQASQNLEIARNTGGIWDAEIVMENTRYHLSIDVDSSNNVHFVCDADQGTGYKLYYGTETGAGWSIEEAYPVSVSNVKLVVDQQNIPHAFFDDLASGSIKHIHKSGSSWIIDTVDSDFTGAFWTQDAIIDSLGVMHVIYGFNPSDDGSMDYDLRYAISSAGSWYVYTMDWNGWAGVPAQFVRDENNLPMIAYRDRSSEDIKFAVCRLYPPPEIDAIDPESAYPGESLPGMMLYGLGLTPVTRVDFGDGILVNGFEAIDDYAMRVDLQVRPDAASGIRSVEITAPAGTAACEGCFVVLEPGMPPGIDSVYPDRAYPGDILRVILQGHGFANTLITGFSGDVDVDDFEILSDEIIRADVMVSQTAIPGERSVWVTSSSGRGECRSCFAILGDVFPSPEPTPSMTPSTPSPATRTPTPSPTIPSTVTITPTGTATLIKTSTPTLTATPSATSTCTSTASMTPTASSPAVTKTPTTTATSTPKACLKTGVEIRMPSSVFRAGDPCFCTAVICNAEDHRLVRYPLFVILDVVGSYFFAPSFDQVFDNYLDEHPEFAPGVTEVEVLTLFEWPQVSGSMSGIKWYGAFTNPEMTELFGELGVFTFGWSD